MQNSKIERAVRFDLVIAVSALLISTLTAGASWWQARVMQAQTAVLQEQLGAQVWPYVSVNEGFADNRVEITLSNDGLGPAVLDSVQATTDGVPKSDFIAILHGLLGPNLVARSKKGEHMGFSIDTSAPGSVIRPGNTGLSYSFTSTRFARKMVKVLHRLDIRVCFCAIIPGKCWIADSSIERSPRPVQTCPLVAGDLLHAATMDEILTRKY